VGRDWETYVVPVAASLLILLLPFVRDVGPQGVKIEPLLPHPEAELKELAEMIKPLLP